MKKDDVLNVLGEELYDTFRKYSVILAGGSIRGLYQQTKVKKIEENKKQKDFTKEDKIKDLDIYFRNEESLVKLEKDLLVLGYKQVFSSLNADSFKKEGEILIQLIKLNDCMGEPENIIKNFDFSACSGAFDFKNEEFLLDENFEQDNNNRKIRFNTQTKYPIASLIRINKYISKKGYKISNVELLKIALSINNLHIENYEELKAQLNGIDTLILKPLTDNLIEGEKYDINKFLDLMNDYLERAFNNGEEEEEETKEEKMKNTFFE